MVNFGSLESPYRVFLSIIFRITLRILLRILPRILPRILLRILRDFQGSALQGF